jgi:recyclin-1
LKNRPSISRTDDDFGDFSTDTFEDVDFGDFSTPTKAKGSLIDLDELPLPSRAGAGGKQSGFFALAPPFSAHLAKFLPGPWYTTYRDHHLSLVPLCRHLQSSPSPSSTLALLFPPPSTMTSQSQTLLQLLLFLSPSLQPLRDWGFLRQALLAASDRFDSTCLVAFEMADSKGDTDAMRNAAQASWSVWEAGSGSRDQWECGRVWVEKREVFYETSKWDPLENIVYVKYLSR